MLFKKTYVFGVQVYLLAIYMYMLKEKKDMGILLWWGIISCNYIQILNQ
jgi:hypothetical protein